MKSAASMMLLALAIALLAAAKVDAFLVTSRPNGHRTHTSAVRPLHVFPQQHEYLHQCSHPRRRRWGWHANGRTSAARMLTMSAFINHNHNHKDEHRRIGRRGRVPTAVTSAAAASGTTAATTTTTTTMTTTSLRALNVPIEGLLEDHDRLEKFDATIRALQTELPRTLTRPLTGVSAARIYASDFQLVVGEDAGVTLCNSRTELINLSEVLVLGTAATQRATSVFVNAVVGSQGAGGAPSTVHCQLILDESFSRLLIPWKTTTSPFGSLMEAFTASTVAAAASRSTNGSNNGNNDIAKVNIEGISEFILDPATSKIKTHRILKVVWNGTPVNNAVIGQTLRGLQDTVGQVQQSPLLGLLLPGSSQLSANLFKDIRDGLMQQAIAAADLQEADGGNSQPLPEVLVMSQEEMESKAQFVEGGASASKSSSSNKNDTAQPKTDPSSPVDPSSPIPGTPSWTQYKIAHNALSSFCHDVIPLLAGDASSADDPLKSRFASNVTFLATDGTVLLDGDDAVVHYFESLAVARKGTRGRWIPQSIHVSWHPDWTVAVSYTADTLPTWTVTGKDEYRLLPDRTIASIRQLEFHVRDANMVLDDKVLMQNLIAALERGRRSTSFLLGSDVLSDILKQTATMTVTTAAAASSRGSSIARTATPPRLNKDDAATMYYIMLDIQEYLHTIWNVPNSTSILDLRVTEPPGAQYMDASRMCLKGYWNETLVRGYPLYRQSIAGSLTQLRRWMARGDVTIRTAGVVVSLVAANRIRVEWTIRIAPVLQLDLVSEYVVAGGKIVQHRIVETKVNGRRTPGDELVRVIRQQQQQGGMEQQWKDVMGWITDRIL